MKKLFMALLCISALALTGCSMKASVNITIDPNENVTMEYLYAADDEMIDGLLSLGETSFLEESEESEETEEKTYTDEERWAFLESSLEEEEGIFETKERYEEDGLKGFQFSREMGKLTDVSQEKSPDEPVLYDDIIKQEKIFVKNGNEYTLHFERNEESDDSAMMESNEEGLEEELTVVLPVKAKSHNADKVSADNLTYTWNLITADSVNLVFEMGEASEAQAPVEQTSSSKALLWSKASDWATEELLEARDGGLVPSIFDSKDVTVNITRKEFAYVVVRLWETLTGERVAAGPKNPFTDTEDPEVLKAYNLEITNGTSETTFSPDDLITREQMATMMTRALSKAKIDTSVDLAVVQPFADDSQMHDWGKAAIYYMSSIDIIKGVGENMFDVSGNATREQALLISVRSAKKFAR